VHGANGMDPARVATPADVPALERVLQANKQAIGDRVRFQQTDVAFRLAIASIPRNPIYLALHEAIVVAQRAPQRGAAPAGRKTFKYGDCRQWFSTKVGTIFEDMKTAASQAVCGDFDSPWAVWRHHGRFSLFKRQKAPVRAPLTAHLRQYGQRYLWFESISLHHPPGMIFSATE
jgi:hypothetical protein